MLTAAFFRVDPNKLGGILTTSTSVDIENNFVEVAGFQFMNLWVFLIDLLKEFGDFPNYCQIIFRTDLSLNNVK